jgi:hypothetical protein
VKTGFEEVWLGCFELAMMLGLIVLCFEVSDSLSHLSSLLVVSFFFLFFFLSLLVWTCTFYSILFASYPWILLLRFLPIRSHWTSLLFTFCPFICIPFILRSTSWLSSSYSPPRSIHSHPTHLLWTIDFSLLTSCSLTFFIVAHALHHCIQTFCSFTPIILFNSTAFYSLVHLHILFTFIIFSLDFLVAYWFSIYSLTPLSFCSSKNELVGAGFTDYLFISLPLSYMFSYLSFYFCCLLLFWIYLRFGAPPFSHPSIIRLNQLRSQNNPDHESDDRLNTSGIAIHGYLTNTDNRTVCY